MDVKAPGASGWFGTCCAALTMPPAPMEGVVGLACSAPPMLWVPWSGGTISSALTVMVTCALALLGCQVALQPPLLREVSGSDGSLSENEAVTFPAVMKLPQSSTTVTWI